MTALEYLPKRTETDPKRIAEREREKGNHQTAAGASLRRSAASATGNRKSSAHRSTESRATRAAFDKLDELLNAQSYRLAFWRVAAEEINYRRFFDVNDLAAIRVELPKVFDAIHRLVLELVSTGAVTGLRIDHPDGLYLPREYFVKLQQRSAKALGIGVASRRPGDLHGGGKNSHRLGNVAQRMAGAWNDRLRFRQSAHAVARRFFG